MVFENRASAGSAKELDSLIVELELAISSFSPEQAEIAREAFRRFGRGRGHPAQLNFGDCMAYALAKERGEPLLFKGDDFSKTDIAVAAY